MIGQKSDKLVLGCVSSLAAECFLPFLRSLHACGFDGQVVLLASGMRHADLLTLREWAIVEAIDDRIPPEVSDRWVRVLRRLKSQRGLRRYYPHIFRAVVGGRDSRWDDLELRLQGLQSLRYRFYRDYLLRYAPGAERILLCDVRDVVFQADPLSDPLPELQVVLEPDHAEIGRDRFNTRWIRQLYGGGAVKRLCGKTASCCGTVLGRRTGLLRYLHAMERALKGHHWPLGPHDQGVHNMLLHTGRLDPVHIQRNEHGRVITCGMQERIRVDPEGWVVNADGSRPAIVHQYDRHDDLVARLVARVTTRREMQAAAHV